MRRLLPIEMVAEAVDAMSRVLGHSLPIRECAALAECPSFGQTIFEYSKHSNGADDYRSLAADLLHGRTM